MSSAAEKASVLIKALPYLQRFRGETFLIKMGGSAMDNPDLVREVMRDIVFLEVAGIKPVIVHGGGKAISTAMEKSSPPVPRARPPTGFASSTSLASAYSAFTRCGRFRANCFLTRSRTVAGC